uniref:hypothetical protein n=1 Tax=Ascoseira mirabilis TaxID=76830 RepID=UPI003001A3CC|nr:hypothetical protein ASMI048 [Ascoseira mirabilis]
MKTLFPFIYSILLFLLLVTISFYIGKQIINIQKVERRIFQLQEKIKNYEVSYEDFYKLGQLYLKKKLFYKAILLFRQALKTWNSNDKIGLASLYNTLGFTYFTLEEYNLAVYYYSISLKVIPEYSLALTNLGSSYEKLHLDKEAYICYKNILLWEPHNQIALNRLLYLDKKNSRAQLIFRD